MESKPSRWPLFIASLLAFLVGAGLTVLVMTGGWLVPDGPPKADNQWGEFPTTARAELLDDGRTLKLLDDFVYVDPRGRVWIAQKDLVVDGASIPRAFWSIAGGPLAGQYRNASIVHDEGCVRKTEPWEEVHFMFYEACRCGGLSEARAKMLYAAVYHFGPRWELKPLHEMRTTMGADGRPRVLTVTRTVAENIQPTREPSPEVREKLQRYIEREDPPLADLKRLNPDAL